MSAKSHVLVSHSFSALQADAGIASKKFHHMTSKEAAGLFKDGRIQPLGTTGKVWQWVERSVTHSYKETAGGRVSLEIPGKMRRIVECEMALRPSWSLAEA